MPVLTHGPEAVASPRRRRFFAGLLAFTVGVLGGLMPFAAAPAIAESNPAGTLIRSTNTFYAYVGAGETLDVSFLQQEPVGFAASTVSVQGPGFPTETCAVPITTQLGEGCEWENLSSPTPGIWAVTYTPSRYMSWDIDVQRDEVDIPGRVWVDAYTMAQRAVPGTDILQGEDFTFFYQAITGDQYRATYYDFNGIDSVFSANAIGLRQPPACEPVYETGQTNGPYADGLRGVTDECGESYKIFFEEPATDLPTSAVRFDGADEWILNPVVDPEVSNIAFAPNSGTVQSGVISFDVENFVGTMQIQIDANGNGSFDDPEDLTIPYTPVGGNASFAFDGVDGLGSTIPASQVINVRAAIDRTGEIHFVNADVELRGGGIEVVSTRGPDAGNATLYWDDSRVNENQAGRCTGPLDAVSALEGVDSTGGVHGWTDCGATPSNANDGIGGSYGDTRYVQEWTYRTVNAADEVSVPARAAQIVVEKSANPASGTPVLPGQVVEYSIVFENTGDADGVVDYDDVIEGVLDDATLTSAPGSSDEALTVSPVVDGRFSVEGTLVADQQVTVTYAVTVNANGDRGDSVLGNFVVPGGGTPPTGCVADSELCTVHPVPQLEVTKTSDADQDTRVGDTVEYTVTAKNVGGLAYTAENPAILTDDLTGVLDDAAYNGDATATQPGTISYTEPKLSWSGALGLGEEVSVSYTTTLVAGGDGVVRNVVYNGAPEMPTPACDPPEDGTDPVTGLACAEEEFELPRLTVEKSSETTDLPADGGVVEYSVTINNVGPGAYTETAPAVVTDDLSAVLDDADFGSITTPADGSAVFDETDETITWTGPLAAGEDITITYTVTYDSAAGDNILYNVACIPASEVAPGADSCADVRIPAAALEVDKSVDPTDGTSVESGQLVAYTIEFASTGQTAADVNKVDDLSDVLDDAQLVSLETSNPALNAVLQGAAGTDLVVTGSVPAGETYTVTYTVRVEEYADQGNHVLANVVQNPDGSCDVGGCPETENPIRHFSVEKDADIVEGVQTGGVVGYRVTVTNDGEGAYTLSAPAAFFDDLSDVLDDASYNGDAVAVASDGSSVPAPTFASATLAWSGPIAVGESVTITYSVTVTNQGDADLVNTAVPVCAPDVICDPETPPVEILLPRITPDKSSNPETGSNVLAGEVITYSLTFTNSGLAVGDVASTDDLSEVLDDAELTVQPTTDVEGITAVFDPETQTIRTEGSLAAGATVTVSYSVTVLADGERGDNLLANVVTPDVPPYLCDTADPECVPFTPPSTEHFVGELQDWKTVNPASGTTVRAGEVVEYTLHFRNIGTAPVSVDREDDLAQVLDDATVTTGPASSDAALAVTDLSEGRFGIAGSLDPGQTVTVTYAVTVNADGARGDDRLANYLLDPGADVPEECVATDDEFPDCTVNHVSNVVVTKSANPASGTEVSEGDRVVYTLTFRNVSTNPSAADVDVDYTDHMADVLDDATLTASPVSSSTAVTSTVAGQTIRIVGTVASGESVTVTYAVMVKSWDAQGDHLLGNVVAVTGDEPICAPGNDLCTSHPVDEPDPLAITGGEIAWGLAAGGFLLLLTGGALLIARSHRSMKRLG